MRRTPLSLYGPFLVLVLVQGLFISVAPSRSPQAPEIASLGSGEGGGAGAPALPGAPAGEQGTSGDGVALPGEAGTTTGGEGTGGTSGAGGATTGGDGTTGGTSTGGTTGGTSGGSSGGSTSGGSTTGGTGSGSTGGTTGGTSGGSTGGGGGANQSQQQQGDTSHCTEDGRQHDVIYQAPPCVPAWTGGDNGGSTYHRGVSADTIKVLVFWEDRNPIVTQILSAEGLRDNRDTERQFWEAAEKFLNQRYEFYDRQVEFVFYDASNCPEAPPDVRACNEEAQAAARENPFAIIWSVPSYPTVFDQWVREGIISLGGWHFDNYYFAGRRPYRYDPFMDGTRTADLLAEYYCNKLAGGRATHSGETIHPTIGNRGEVDRRVGIVVPDTDANVRVAQRVVDLINQCGDPQPAYFLAYNPDPSTGAQQAQPNTERFIADKVTTVICLCDPIAPVFRTRNMTRNRYYPEVLLPGSGLLDYDKLGRLYDSEQMLHAFGPSHLTNFVPHEHSDASRIWRDAGMSGDACTTCNLYAAYVAQLGAMLQMAGPDLNPLTVEQGMLSLEDRGGWEESGGDATRALCRYGQDDYTCVSDIREVWWNPNEPSPIDGRNGTYVATDGGRRYEPGEVPTAFDVPVAPR